MNATYNEAAVRWELTVDKDMDLYTVPELKQAVLDCINSRRCDVFLDATAMGYIDSTGLGVLVSALNRVKEFNGTITIKGLKPHIRRIFHLSGLDGAFVLED